MKRTLRDNEERKSVLSIINAQFCSKGERGVKSQNHETVHATSACSFMFACIATKLNYLQGVSILKQEILEKVYTLYQQQWKHILPLVI